MQVELTRQGLLNGVDHRQLGRPPFGQRQRRAGFGGALGRLLCQTIPCAQVGQCLLGQSGQRDQQVGVGFAEAAEATLDVGIEEAQYLAAGPQRRHQAAALVGDGGAVRSVTQSGGARAARFGQPGRHRHQQLLGIFARRQAAPGDPQFLGAVQQQHRAARAQQTGCLAERHARQCLFGTLRVQPQADGAQAVSLALAARMVRRPCGRSVRTRAA